MKRKGRRLILFWNSIVEKEASKAKLS